MSRIDEAPETIGLVLGGLASRGLDDWAEAQTLEVSIATHYVRADIAEQRNCELESINTEHEKQIHKLIQECERLREKLDAELFGFPYKPLVEPK